MTMGCSADYCTRKSAVQKYAAACQFVQPEFIVSAKLAEAKGAKTVSCSYYHKASADMQLGVALAKPLSKPDVAIEFGCNYQLDGDTKVKAKVDSEGILCASYKQNISKLTTMTLAAQVAAPAHARRRATPCLRARRVLGPAARCGRARGPLRRRRAGPCPAPEPSRGPLRRSTRSTSPTTSTSSASPSTSLPERGDHPPEAGAD